MTTADTSGSWQATNVPIRTLDVVAVTFDGTRSGVRLGVDPVANQITYANVTLRRRPPSPARSFRQRPSRDQCAGRRRRGAGASDANGNFQLQGVPVGTATSAPAWKRTRPPALTSRAWAPRARPSCRPGQLCRGQAAPGGPHLRPGFRRPGQPPARRRSGHSTGGRLLLDHGGLQRQLLLR